MSESGCQLRDYEDIVKKILGNGSSYLTDELGLSQNYCPPFTRLTQLVQSDALTKRKS